ncbi:MAG: HlyD family efflux transporter periplasmic adaptor subunit [Lachnospiraceae bacterium]|nr:HlyD family efflux transporter periplasmic adaptor subunit [Lachnospiraceae bacterium]
MARNKSKRPERRKQRVSENRKGKQRQSKKVRNDKNQRNDNVVVYKPPVNINLGLGIFVLLIGYLIIIIISYLKSKPITPYEVSMGSLAVNNTYNGVALREEVLVSADYSGYVNYYAREGEKVSKGTMIYTIDSTGKLSDVVGTESTSENKLSDNDLFEIKSDISEFANSFDPINFNHTYNFKYDIEGTVLKLENYRVLSGIEKINSANYSDAVSFGYAPTSGVLVYAVDGYEQLKAEDLTPEMLDSTQYVRSQFHSGDLIADNDNAYKLVTSENWSIVIEIDEARAKELEDETYVEVRFLKNNYKSWAATTILHQNGATYLKLDFNNSMITFASDRFIEIELLLNTQSGLKIPNSAIVERAFYLIPEKYYTEGGSQGNPGFIRESYLEDGSKSTEFVDAEVYAFVDGYYYVDESLFNVGDKLLMPDSEATYTVSKQDTLVGVFNINKGYADFKEITILNANDEYSIVKSNSEYGLNVYDHIVLKGDTVSDRDFIYE